MKNILVLKTVKTQDMLPLLRDLPEANPGERIFVLSEPQDDFSRVNVQDIKRPPGMLNVFKLDKTLKKQIKNLEIHHLYLPVYKNRVWFYRHPMLLASLVKPKKKTIVNVTNNRTSGLNTGYILRYLVIDGLRYLRRIAKTLISKCKKGLKIGLIFLYIISLMIINSYLSIKNRTRNLKWKY